MSNFGIPFRGFTPDEEIGHFPENFSASNFLVQHSIWDYLFHFIWLRNKMGPQSYTACSSNYNRTCCTPTERMHEVRTRDFVPWLVGVRTMALLHWSIPIPNSQDYYGCHSEPESVNSAKNVSKISYRRIETGSRSRPAFKSHWAKFY